MTIQAIDSFLWPQLVATRGTVSTSLSVTAAAQYTLATTSAQACLVFYCPVGGSLTDFGVRTQTVSVTSGPLNWDFRVETVSNGRPTGNLWATNTNSAVSVANTDDNVWKSATLTAAATVAQGDLIALVIRSPSSGTFSFTAGGFSNLQASVGGNFPYCMTDSAGDNTYETLVSGAPSMSIKISGTWLRIEPLIPIMTATAATVNNGTNPDEFALRLYPPVKMRMKGAAFYIGNCAAGADFKVSVWPDSAGSQTDSDALVQVAVDGDLMATTNNDGAFNVVFPTSLDLEANTPYWLGVRAETANSFLIYHAVPISATLQSAWPGGIEVYGGQRAWAAGSASAFSHFTNDAGSPFFAGIFDGIDVPGMVRHPGMAGGLLG